MGFTQCVHQKFENNYPFTITSATHTNVFGGLSGNNSIDLRLGFSSSKNIEFKQLFYLHKKAKVVIEIKGGVKYIVARYNTSPESNLVMHGNSKEEYGNSPPEDHFPFVLKENEAVLSYKEGEKIKFVKIEKIRQEKRVFMQ